MTSKWDLAVQNMYKQLQSQPLKKIIFPEGNNPKIVEAARLAAKEKVFIPILISEKKINDIETIIMNDDLSNRLIDPLLKVRNGKLTKEDAAKWLKNPIYVATMLLHLGEVDGFVGGIDCPTANILRAGFQIIKMSSEYSKASSCNIMALKDDLKIFADISTNINPTSNELAEIAIAASSFAKRTLNLEPSIALLSFSTKSSAVSPESSKVADAVEILKTKQCPYPFDGEMQLDAALLPEIRSKKAPNSPLKGAANVLIFPNLDAGNIGYKLVERFGNYKAIGPIILGMNKPFNDLSRGANIEAIFYTSLITAIQSLT